MSNRLQSTPYDTDSLDMTVMVSLTSPDFAPTYIALREDSPVVLALIGKGWVPSHRYLLDPVTLVSFPLPMEDNPL
jgi:hypothetical protein